MEENKKKKIIVTIIAIIVLLCAIVTATYAYFSVKSKADEQQITTAKVDLIVEVDEENTHIENLKPTKWSSDIEENKANEKIAKIPINVINKSSIAVKYYLRILTEGLELNSDTTLTGGDLSDVKYVLLDNKNNEVTKGDFTDPKLEQTMINRKDIKKDETQQYVLYVYIEEVEDLQNKLQGLSFDLIINGDTRAPEYQRLEYIETTGTQWIDTKIDCYNKAIEVTYLADDQYMDLGNVIIGTNNTNCTNYHFTLYNDAYYYGGGNTERHAGSSDYGTKHTVKYNFKDETLVVDNEIIDSVTFDPMKGYNIYIGRRVANNLYSKMKYYSVKIYEKDTEKLILDLIPAKDRNNIACMYDLVNEEFYYNSGTDEFIAGLLK